MHQFKKSFAALAGVLVLVSCLSALTPLIIQGQGGRDDAPPHRGPRQFYLTQTTHNGSEALSACAESYHMASLWEILDPSNLRYDTERGYTEDDSGFGRPLGQGWMRTGNFANTITGEPGSNNCQAWTSLNGHGSVVTLNPSWRIPITTHEVIFPWNALAVSCVEARRVWCVQD